MSFTFFVLYDRKIILAESLGFIGLYLLYVLVVVIGRYIYQKQKRNRILSIRADISEDGSEAVDAGTSNQETMASDELGNQAGCQSGYENGYESTLPGGSIDSGEPTWDMSGKFDYKTEMRSLLKVSSEEQVTLPEVDERTRRQKFIDAVKPFDTEDWRDLKWYGRIYIVVRTPITVMLKLTVPVVNFEAIQNNWNKDLHALQCVTGPVVAVFLADYSAALYMFGGVFPACLLVTSIGVILAAVVWFTSSHSTPPVYHPAFAFLGFGVAVIWIYSIANEIVNLLQAIGVVLNISNAVLGLTLLAWGNSVGDLIADTTMARHGLPRTGISACFGGPLFNLLLGIGIPFTIKVIGEPGQELVLDFSLIDILLTAVLLLSLVSSPDSLSASQI